MTSNNSSVVLMTPYLHFTGEDHLYFRSWHPSSGGAIAGASIILLILAILERLLHATCAVMDAHWRRRYALYDYLDYALALDLTFPAGNSVAPPTKESRNVRRTRTIPPFVLSRDCARGALYSLQASLSYALMLAVMTFQAAYIISIIVGLGLGEVLFGRLAHAHL
ncbi:copper transporter [Russula earlei]|uniref:Copper transporter n=1 Tax=Russula earlei TaxID=71964 RepID=A0ACC0UNG8_9AGAM|nr:copper transporter [Russula earlei]